MNIDTVFKKANNDAALNDQEVGVLMLHAINLLERFNVLTEKSIKEKSAIKIEKVEKEQLIAEYA